MSLKHLKFEDSFTMRSLEKLAISKGMIKPDAVVKNASQSQLGQDLEPTKDLVQNILKLCDGLRASGFEKQADALEFKFVQFKKEANELYNTSKEVGEDLVDAAHPKGSYKLEGVAGDATVETIIDQKKKIQDIVNKKPTGKLANNKDIIKAVKIVLAQVVDKPVTDEDVERYARTDAVSKLRDIPPELNKAMTVINNKMNTTTLKTSFSKDLSDINSLVGSVSAETITVTDVDNVISKLKSMLRSLYLFNWRDVAGLTPLGFLPTVLHHVGDIADIVKGNFDFTTRDELINIVNKVLKEKAELARAHLRGENNASIRSRVPEEEKKQEEKKQEEKKKQDVKKTESDPFLSKLKAAKNTVDTYLQYMDKAGFDADDLATGKNILNDIKNKIKNELDAFESATDKEIQKDLSSTKLDVQISRLSNFRKKWFK